MIGIILDQQLQAFNALLEFLHLQVSVAPEVESLHILRVHLKYLVSDVDYALPFLPFMFADNQIQECDNLDGLKLSKCLLINFALFILFLIVVS